MGNRFTSGNDNTKRELVMMEGLHDSGKTSLLFKLKFGEELRTCDSNREQLDLHGMTLNCWDLYGRDKNRPFVHIYYRMTRGFVYVIDSADKESLEDALYELVQYILLEKSTFGTVVMVLANKQDLPGAMTALQIEEALKKKYKFSPFSASRHIVFVRPCSVKTNEGVDEAFAEFVKQLKLSAAGAAKSGLLSLADTGNDVNVKDADFGALPSKEMKESLAKAKVKNFLKNPFCLFNTAN